MKKFVLAAIIAVVALVSASAQERDIYSYLVKNQRDTVQISQVSSRNGADSVVITKKAVFLGENRVGTFSDTLIIRRVVNNSSYSEDFRVLSAKTKVGEQSFSYMRYNKKTEKYEFYPKGRDTYLSQPKEFEGTDEGKVVLYGINKYGAAIGAYVGYQYSEGKSSPYVGVNLNYSRKWWQSGFNFEGGKSFYIDDESQLKKNYVAYRSELYLGIRPFQLDKNDCNRLLFVGGLGFEHYTTDNSVNEDESNNLATTYNYGGSYLYPTAGLRYEHRFFATGNSIYTTIMWRGVDGFLDNPGDKTYHSIGVSFGFTFGLLRDTYSNVIGGRKAAKSMVK